MFGVWDLDVFKVCGMALGVNISGSTQPFPLLTPVSPRRHLGSHLW